MATSFLASNGFKKEDVCVMTDEHNMPSDLDPTRENIVRILNMRFLVPDNCLDRFNE